MIPAKYLIWQNFAVVILSGILIWQFFASGPEPVDDSKYIEKLNAIEGQINHSMHVVVAALDEQAVQIDSSADRIQQSFIQMNYNLIKHYENIDTITTSAGANADADDFFNRMGGKLPARRFRED